MMKRLADAVMGCTLSVVRTSSNCGLFTVGSPSHFACDQVNYKGLQLSPGKHLQKCRPEHCEYTPQKLCGVVVLKTTHRSLPERNRFMSLSERKLNMIEWW